VTSSFGTGSVEVGGSIPPSSTTSPFPNISNIKGFKPLGGGGFFAGLFDDGKSPSGHFGFFFSFDQSLKKRQNPAGAPPKSIKY